MKEYTKTIKTRIWLYSALLVIALALCVLSYVLGPHTGQYAYLSGFQVGALTSSGLLLAIILVRLVLGLRNPEKLRAMYVQDTDERNRMIKEKTGGTTFTVFNFLLLFAAVPLGYYNILIFYTLIAVALIFALFRGVVAFYYQSKH